MITVKVLGSTIIHAWCFPPPVNVGEDCPVFDGLFEFCQLSAGGSAGESGVRLSLILLATPRVLNRNHPWVLLFSVAAQRALWSSTGSRRTLRWTGPEVFITLKSQRPRASATSTTSCWPSWSCSSECKCCIKVWLLLSYRLCLLKTLWQNIKWMAKFDKLCSFEGEAAASVGCLFAWLCEALGVVFWGDSVLCKYKLIELRNKWVQKVNEWTIELAALFHFHSKPHPSSSLLVYWRCKQCL